MITGLFKRLDRECLCPNANGLPCHAGNATAPAARWQWQPRGSPPIPGKGRDLAVGSGKAERHEIGMQSLQRPPLLTRLPRLVFNQPASFSAKGSSLLGRNGVENFTSIVSAARYFVTVFRDRASPPRDLSDRQLLAQSHTSDEFKSPMWITPLPPSLTAQEEGSHGSNLSGNYAATRLCSACKSTDWAR